MSDFTPPAQDDIDGDPSDLTRLIIERAHNAFVSMDVAGRITEWNPSAVRIFGWTRAEALGRTVADVVMPARYRDAHALGLKRFLATGDGPVLNRTIEIEAVRRDGSEFPVALTISPIEMRGEYSFHAFIQDISERRENEAERERHAAELAHANTQLQEAQRRLSELQAHELYDAVLQGQTVAKMAVEAGEHDMAVTTLAETIEATRRILTKMMHEAGVEPTAQNLTLPERGGP